MSWFKDTNIDFAEIATVYRTPDQGVSAKSNSNIILNDYRKMPPQANGSNNAITTASSQTLRLDDFADTGGVVGGYNSYTTGSTKGQVSSSIIGYFTAAAAASVRGDGSSTAQGYSKLGAQSGSAALAGVASFGTPSTFGYYLDGIGANSGSLGGSIYVIATGSGYQASAPPENAWSTIRVRTLYPGGSFESGGVTYYNYTSTFNRSDGSGWSSSVSGTRRTWTTTWGLTGTYSGLVGWVGNAVHTIEFV